MYIIFRSYPSYFITAYYHISKTIEVSRVHLFDIITQYRAVFPDDDPLLSAGSSNQANTTKPVAIFYCWLIQKVKIKS